jgi:hypothetical protein
MRRIDSPPPLVINVKDYGARGDGVTDDYAAIALACTAAGSSGSVYFPTGTYKFATTITRPAGVQFIGDGIGATTLSYTGVATAIAAPTPGVRSYRGGIARMTISTATGATGIDFDSVSLAYCENIEITGFSGTGLWLHSAVSGGCVYNRFYDVQVAFGTNGILIQASSTNANTFVGGRTNLCNVGVAISDSNDNTFIGFQAESGDTGFYVHTGTTGLADHNRFIACRAEHNTDFGFWIPDVEVRYTEIIAPWLGSNGADYADFGTKTHRPMDFYLTAGGAITSDLNAGFPNYALSSASGQIQAAANTGLYLKGNIPDSAGNVGVWAGNNPTLTNATAYPFAVCADVPATHAVPVLYVRKDGAVIANGPLISKAIVAKTANYTATLSDEVITCDSSGGAFTITLPAVASTEIGKRYLIEKTDSSRIEVSIDGNASETIDGFLIYKLQGQGASILIENTGATWWVVDAKLPRKQFIESVTKDATIAAATVGANVAYCMRIQVEAPITVATLSIVNGGTISGNVDVGIYRSDGTTLTRLVSAGSTAQAGVSAIQTFNTTDVDLFPGFEYYLVFSIDNTTGILLRATTSSAASLMSKRVVAFNTSFPLPSTLTISSGVASTNMPYVIGEV